MRPTLRHVVLPLCVVAALAAAMILGWDLRGGGGLPPSPIAAPTGEVAVTSVMGIGGDFTLVGPNGQPVTLASYRGRLVLMFFGYRYCPDICPTELAKVAAALDGLDDTARARVAALFITIDPERDTPVALREYTALFHPAIQGLTGNAEQIALAARNYRVFYERRGEGRGPDDYLMDHSAMLYLLGPDGTLRRLFTANAAPETIARRLRDLLAEQPNHSSSTLGDKK